MFGRFSDGRSFVPSKERRISTLIQQVEHQVSYLHDTQGFVSPTLGMIVAWTNARDRRQESASKWKALNLRKVKDTAPAESVGASKMGFSGKVMELEILPKKANRIYQSLPDLKFFLFYVSCFSLCSGTPKTAGGLAGRRSSLELQPGLPQLAQTDIRNSAGGKLILWWILWIYPPTQDGRIGDAPRWGIITMFN